MNKVEKWIEENKTKRNNSWNWRIDGYYIEDILPNTFESYAIIYHPYKLPLELLITNEENERREAKQFVIRANELIAEKFKIPIMELPIDKYDIEETIRKKIGKDIIDENELEIKLKELEDSILRLALQPLQDTIDNIDVLNEVEVEKREAQWKEVFKFHDLRLDASASWYDTSDIDSKLKIFNSEMPDQDNIPISVLEIIGNYLLSQQIETVNINSLSNTVGFQHLIRKDSENRPIVEVSKYDTVHILSSIDNDWIFVNPYDYCRTIVASSREFITHLKNQTTLEISEFVNSKHRFNKLYTDNT